MPSELTTGVIKAYGYPMVVTNPKEQLTLNPISTVDIPYLRLSLPDSTCGGIHTQESDV